MINTNVDKAVPFHDPLKRLKLKTFASDGLLKKDNNNSLAQFIMSSNTCFFIHPLISALFLET